MIKLMKARAMKTLNFYKQGKFEEGQTYLTRRSRDGYAILVLSDKGIWVNMYEPLLTYDFRRKNRRFYNNFVVTEEFYVQNWKEMKVVEERHKRISYKVVEFSLLEGNGETEGKRDFEFTLRGKPMDVQTMAEKNMPPFFGLMGSIKTNMFFQEDVLKTNESNNFYLLRFEEGTRIDTKNVSSFSKVMWTKLFIPVIGVETDLQLEELLTKVKQLKGFKRIKEVEKFHELSFMEI